MSQSTPVLKNVLSKSKKITKDKSSSSRKSSGSLSKYLTFGSSEKKTILTDVKKTLSKLRSLKLSVSSVEFLEILNEIEREEFNQLLLVCLPRHIEGFDCSTENLRVWRRRVKDWMKVIDKPESRGCLLVPLEKQEEFKKHLINELKSFSYRNLKMLKPKLYQIFKLIDKPINDKNTCSKHWWYDFLKANSEVKDVWEALPKRGGRSSVKIEEGEDSEDSSETQYEEENLTKEEESPEIHSIESIGDSTNICSPSNLSEQAQLFESPENNEETDTTENFSVWPFDKNFSGFLDEWNEEFQAEKRELEDLMSNSGLLKKYGSLETYINPNAFEQLLP